eukprot:756758-Hanusia_phi.AAC.10
MGAFKLRAGGFNAWELREQGQEADEDEERMKYNVWYNMHREIVERQIMLEMSRYGKVAVRSQWVCKP